MAWREPLRFPCTRTGGGTTWGVEVEVLPFRRTPFLLNCPPPSFAPSMVALLSCPSMAAQSQTARLMLSWAVMQRNWMSSHHWWPMIYAQLLELQIIGVAKMYDFVWNQKQKRHCIFRYKYVTVCLFFHALMGHTIPRRHPNWFASTWAMKRQGSNGPIGPKFEENSCEMNSVCWIYGSIAWL